MLRDFNSPTADSSIEKPVILKNDPAGNGNGLGAFHTTNPEDIKPDNTGKMIGGLVVLLMLGGIGVYAYSVSGHAPKPVVAANNLPSPPPPTQVAAQTPPPAPDAMTAPDANTPAGTPTPAAMPAPVKSADTSADITPVKTRHTSRMARAEAKVDTSTDKTADSLNGNKSLTVIDKNQTASATPSTPAATPLPTPPAPSPNDMASNNAQASVTPAPAAPAPAPVTTPPATTTAQNTTAPVAPQQAQSATPQADNAAPAQNQQSGATPAPAAPAPQQ